MSRFLDANVIAKAFVDNADRGKCQFLVNSFFVTNMLCLVEAQHSIERISSDRIYAAECIRSIFRSAAVIVPFDRNLLFNSLKFAPEPRFDAVHYTTALLSHCTEFVSYDKELDNLPIKRTEP